MLSRRRQKNAKEPQPTTVDNRHETPVRSNTKQTEMLMARESRDVTATSDTIQNGPQHTSIPAIYAAPTVDTLDDGSLMGRDYWGNNAQSPLRKSNRRVKPITDEQNGVMRHHVSFTPTSIGSSSSFATSQYTYHHTAHSPTRAKIGHQDSTAEESPQQSTHPKRKRRKQTRDFQHKEDAMQVTVRSVNVAQRSAFAVSQPVSIEEWHMAAQRIDSKNKGPNKQAASSSLANAQKKLSPSLQLLKVLHSMQSLDTIRQLSFSPSVGIDSDVFVSWWEDALTSREGSTDKKLKRRASSVAEQRDGRYRSIHPVQATLSTLPETPPTLSNKKLRRPMRADVGLPNATEEEIKQKQAEINRETEWEEASPRLIVMVTSDDLGTAVEEESDPIIHPDHWEWNGGGLQGIPWAGRELLRAKELNALHFSRKSSILSLQRKNEEEQEGSQSPAFDTKKKLLEPNRFSVLAPPLDASYSKTLQWRPRPFHDRYPGMEYLLAWPLQVAFDAGDLEPLICSLTLYNLPTPESSSSSGTGSGVSGKISEDYFFPAGDWEGKIHLDPSCLKFPSTAGTSTATTGPKESELMDSWRQRKQKAVVSYDPRVIRGGKESLFWVLQIYRVSNDEAAANYLKDSSNKKTSSVKKLFRSSSRNNVSAIGEQGPADSFYEAFGTKLMTSLGFGVQSVLDHQRNAQNDFPRGQVQEMKLWATPPVPESQEEFVQRLQRLTNPVGDADCWEPISEFGFMTNSSLVHSELSHTSEGPSAFDLASTASSVSERSIPKQMSASSLSERNSFRSSETRKTSPLTRKKKSLKQMIWISPAKATRSLSLKSSSQSTQKAVHTTATRSTSNGGGSENSGKFVNSPLAASARIFTSVLNADWLEIMLNEPTDMDGFKLSQPAQLSSNSKMPKLLCDVSGDFAVMLEERGAGKKRSNLIRTPSHIRPAGYSATSEIREVLFLPARAEKQYDVDIPPSFRSLLNLLYLYPRLLRASPDGQQLGNKHKKFARFTVRVRLVRSSLEVDPKGTIASSQETLEAFHSPNPWTGSPLVNEVFTKMAPTASLPKMQKGTKIEQPMRDEFKLRLPTILDGTFFLQFTLFELESDNTLRLVAENSIPLSSSSVRDSASGSKVATCIPNGCHRVKLGDWRLCKFVRICLFCPTSIVLIMLSYPSQTLRAD
jgi:hypothetical protein